MLTKTDRQTGTPTRAGAEACTQTLTYAQMHRRTDADRTDAGAQTDVPLTVDRELGMFATSLCRR